MSFRPLPLPSPAFSCRPYRRYRNAAAAPVPRAGAGAAAPVELAPVRLALPPACVWLVVPGFCEALVV